MRRITPSVFFVALVLAGCVDEIDTPPPQPQPGEGQPVYEDDELLQPGEDPIPDDESDGCQGSYKKADGECLP